MLFLLEEVQEVPEVPQPQGLHRWAELVVELQEWPPRLEDEHRHGIADHESDVDEAAGDRLEVLAHRRSIRREIDHGRDEQRPGCQAMGGGR